MVLEYSFMISTIASSASSDSGLMVALLMSNSTVFEYSFSSCTTSTVGSGHPLLEAGPATSGQSSSLSNTPSPSVSSHGQPLFSAGPGSLGHSSSLSITPSPSASGHPLVDAGPASVGHSSCGSGIPSPSVSGHPSNSGRPG